MRLIKILVIATAIMSINIVTATENKESKKTLDPYKEWVSINRQVSANLETTFGVVTKVGDFTNDDFSNWKKACESVIANYNNMGNFNGLAEPNFDLPTDWKLNDKLYKAIKDGASKGIDKTLASKWETAYKAFEDKYKQVKKSCEEMYSEKQKDTKATSPTATKIDTVFVYKSMYDSPDSIDKMNNLIKENKRLTEQYNLIQSEINSTQSQTESNTNGFRVCCTFPLAVKYYPNGVKVALEAATQMELAKTVTDPELLGHWEKYKPLLTNYGKYNDEVIKYLQEQKAYMAKRGWKIDNVDVISIKRNLTTELAGYGSHYKKDYCIKYLDYVIDKYFDRLEKAAAGRFTLSPAFYDFFIENELIPTEY